MRVQRMVDMTCPARRMHSRSISAKLKQFAVESPLRAALRPLGETDNREFKVAAVQRIERKTIQFIDDFGGWDRTVPTTLITAAATLEERRERLEALVSRALGLSPALFEIEHAPDRPPIIAKPLGAGLYLSTASRGRIAALAAAPGPVGVDVEKLDIGAEVPWKVLHPEEVAALKALSGYPQAMGFARLWSLKESYLKALGVGLMREPSSFAIGFLDGEAATVDDDRSDVPVADARTTWRAVGGVWTAISTVMLGRQRRYAKRRVSR
jgi:4'-phosphopantetheinyl transferase